MMLVNQEASLTHLPRRISMRSNSFQELSAVRKVRLTHKYCQISQMMAIKKVHLNLQFLFRVK